MFICRFCKKDLGKDKWHRQKKIFCNSVCQISWIRSPEGKKEWRRVQEINKPILKKRIGQLNPAWKSAEKRKIQYTTSGYRQIPIDNHPLYIKKRMILEHRFIMENFLRKNKANHPALIEINNIKYLSPNWIVHHKDGNKSNNNIKNLEALFHTRHHYGFNLICPHCQKKIHKF